ncbi:MAG: superoxide dismutase [Deltaproteobacteria bacterium]|nr:superoxide dismutase [Deltaproteobacteria bacterium]
MKKRCFEFLCIGVSLIIFSGIASAHCEIPCGIYDDETRIKMILEHISTIEKSINEILNIEKKEHHNSNQLIRWIMNKEHHADELQEIVTQYFMTQRIKIDSKDYDKKLAILHQILIYSMKCKQTTDLSNIEKLRNLLKEFQALYFERK